MSSAISSGLGSLLSSPLEKIAGFLAGGLVSSLGDLLGGLFGGDGEGEGDGDGTTALTGTLNIPQENITFPEAALDLKGKIALTETDITAPVEVVDLKGRINAIEELSESVKLPPVPGLTGGIGRLVLPPGVDRPIVPGLTGEIAQIQLAEGLTLPTLPGIVIPVTFDTPDLPVGNVEVGPLEVVPDTPAPTPPEATAPTDPIDLTGMITLALADITAPTDAIALQGAIALVETDITAPTEATRLMGAITLVDTDIIAPTTATDFQGVINADVNVLTAQPIALAGVINATVRTPDLPEGFVDVGELEVLPDTPTPTPLEALEGVINAELNKTFTEPIALAGVINATVRTPDLPEGLVDVGELEVLPDTPAPTPLEALGGVINADVNVNTAQPIALTAS